MGKATGFIEYSRKTSSVVPEKERICNFDEFHIPLSAEEQKIQGARCMECGVPFCQAGIMLMGMTAGCPLNNLIPEWNDFVFRGNWKLAYERLRKTNNFPEFTARVCPAPCEGSCTCGLHGEPVAIKENEYAIIENAFKLGYADANPPKVRTGKKVAVVGSGPAGLAVADELNQRGHSVTVFERHDRVGGLLMYGIPNMKLDKQVIERKVQIMKQEGIEFETNADVGADPKFSPERLCEEFDRVVLACGASNPRDIAVPGRDAEGIYFAVDFLRLNTKSLLDSQLTDKKNVSAKDKKVVIIGGGDTGNDCVGTCIRHGAKEVVQLEMMPKPPLSRTEDNPWPEWPKTFKVDYGQEESIAIYGKDPRVFETTVKEFVKDAKGRVKNVVTVSLQWEVEAGTGRRVMKEVEGSQKTIAADLVIIAAGFLGTQKYIADAFGVSLDGRSNVQTGPKDYKTNQVHVFATGDMRRGQSLVVWAIREGREAARDVDFSLMGYTNL